MRAPDKLWLARRVGSTDWHIPVKGETMSWGNAEFASYTRTDSTHTGAAWMREQAAVAIGNFMMTKTDVAVEKVCDAEDAIRAIPLPSNADLLAEAMKLPEVAALVEARITHIKAVEAYNAKLALVKLARSEGFYGGGVDAEFKAVGESQRGFYGASQDFCDAVIAHFTAAKETP